MSVQRVIPIYTADDLERTLAWYRDVIGCKVGETFEEEGRLVGAAVEWGDVSIYLSQDDFSQGRDRRKGVGCRVMMETAGDVDAMAAGIRERGGELVMEPTDQPWGVRMFAVEDPDGFKISISTPMPADA